MRLDSSGRQALACQGAEAEKAESSRRQRKANTKQCIQGANTVASGLFRGCSFPGGGKTPSAGDPQCQNCQCFRMHAARSPQIRPTDPSHGCWDRTSARRGSRRKAHALQIPMCPRCELNAAHKGLGMSHEGQHPPLHPVTETRPSSQTSVTWLAQTAPPRVITIGNLPLSSRLIRGHTLSVRGMTTANLPSGHGSVFPALRRQTKRTRTSAHHGL
jgi:hypothetical protein